MPELPEVETVRRGLEPWVTGRRIAAVAVTHPRAVRRHAAGAADFAGRLVGRRVGVPRRRGKYLWMALSDGLDGDPTEPSDTALLAHLGMSGQLLVEAPEAPDERHLRVRVTFTDGGRELRFVDQRTFGGLLVSETDPAGLPQVITHIAPDPLEPDFDDEGFVWALRRRRTGVKRALLDQTLISGVGNIYADEALWRARLHYARPTERLTQAQGGLLLGCVREVMTEALASGGTSFDALYVDVNGASGYFDRSLRAYGQAGRPCARCASPIRRDPFMNRSSFTCPRCQPRPRAATGRARS